MFEPCAHHPLPAPEGGRYRGLAFDGCCFYLTMQCVPAVLRLDGCFRRQERLETRRAYAALCYDRERQCFWAVADGCPGAVYQLNRRLEETGRITVRDPAGRLSPILSLSFRRCDDCLLAAFADGLVRVCPVCPEEAAVLQTAGRSCFLGALALGPFSLCYCQEGGRADIRAYDGCGGLVCREPLPACGGLESAVFCPGGGDGEYHILALQTARDGYPRLRDYRLDCPTLCPWDRPPCPPPCSPACGDVLESLALTQAALAHILNAEVETLQRVLSATDDVRALLEVNESVQKMLTKVVQLEQLLCCQLEQLGECRETSQ